MSLKADVPNSVELVFNGTSLMGRVYSEKANNKKFSLFSGNWYRKRRNCLIYLNFVFIFKNLIKCYTSY